MAHLRPALRAYILGVLGAAGGVTLVAVATMSAPTALELVLFAVLAALATVAQRYPVHLSAKIKLTADDAPLFAAAIALPAGLAVVAAAGSALVGMRHQPQVSWYNRAFNAGANALATAAAAATFRTLAVPGDVAALAIAVAFAAAAAYLLQRGVVDVAAALQLRRRPFARWWEVHAKELPYSAAVYLVGGLGGLLAGSSPLAAFLLAAPTVVVAQLLTERVRLREQTRLAIVELADLIDLRDPYTHGHSLRVAALAERLGRRLRLAEAQVELIREAARVHDIGKIATDDRLLLKAGPLDADERREMEKHAEYGHRILARLPEFWEGAELVLAHHERYDGKGYPRGLKGDELPLEVSVIAVADSYDAMTTDRPYRRALSWAEVRRELLAGRGVQWHAQVVDAFLALAEEELRAGTLAPEPARLTG